MEKFSSFLTSRRKEMKLSQSELGDILGYSMQTISNWETGRCLPDLCLWDNLARALDIDVTGLLTMEIRNEDNFENRHFDMAISAIQNAQKREAPVPIGASQKNPTK